MIAMVLAFSAAAPLVKRASAGITCELVPPATYKCVASSSAAPSSVQPLGAELPLQWRRSRIVDPAGLNAAGCVPVLTSPPPGAPVPPGGEYWEQPVLYAVSVWNTDTNDIVSSDVVCDYPPENPPGPPPPPPGHELIIDSMQDALKVPSEHNPGHGVPGLTGLDTWLWCDDPGAVGPSVQLNGWKAEVTASVTKLHWLMAGPSPAERSSEGCGSEGQPAATWIPETMGAHQITLTATYSGTWTLSGEVDLGAGSVPVEPQTFPLADVVVPGDAVDYPVVEHVGVLVG